MQDSKAFACDLEAFTGYDDAAGTPRENLANGLEKMQCVLSWHCAFRSLSVVLQTPPREGIMPNRDKSSFVPARL
jgi:hypothetical protein